MMASGTNFRTVVTTCTQPPCFTPSALTNVRSQTAPTASSAIAIVLSASPGHTTVVYPTNAIAIAALPTQAAIQ